MNLIRHKFQNVMFELSENFQPQFLVLSVCPCQLSSGVSLERLCIHDLGGPFPSSFVSETSFCSLATLVVTDFFHACPKQNFSCCHTSKHTRMPP